MKATKEQENIAQRQLKLMETGFRFGKHQFNREELHERNNSQEIRNRIRKFPRRKVTSAQLAKDLK